MTQEHTAVCPPPAKRRHILFVLLIGVLTYGLAQVLAPGALYLNGHTIWSSQFREKQTFTAIGGGASAGATETVYPDPGWVHNPQVTRPTRLFGNDIPVNRLGFMDAGDSIQQRSLDRDQTMLFAGITDTIYVDPYCHYNERRNMMLATAVGEQLCRLLTERNHDVEKE